MSGNFLPPQLIYGGKTTQSLPKYDFPKLFSLSVNPTHYSNSQESVKLIEEILVPYFTKKRRVLGLTADQKGFVMWNLFNVCSLQFPNDSNSLEANQNRSNFYVLCTLKI